MEATVHMLAAGVTLGRVELLDDISIDIGSEFSDLDLPASPTLFLELSGTSAAVEEQTLMAGTYVIYVCLLLCCACDGLPYSGTFFCYQAYFRCMP